MARPVARRYFPHRCEYFPTVPPGRQCIRPAIAYIQHTALVQTCAARPVARLGHIAGLHSGPDAAVLCQYAHCPVQLIYAGKPSALQREYLARSAALRLVKNLRLALRQASGEHKAIQAAVLKISQKERAARDMRPVRPCPVRTKLPQHTGESRIHGKIVSALKATTEHHAFMGAQVTQSSARHFECANRTQAFFPYVIGSDVGAVRTLRGRINDTIISFTTKRRCTAVVQAEPLHRTFSGNAV